MWERAKNIDPRAVAALIPLLLVNGIAVTGQLEFWKTNLPWPFTAVVIFALALESVSVFLAYHAHLAQVSDDSALRLRLASYGFGVVIGILNASHYLHDGRITAAAIGLGLMSASSPWLWAVHSRRANRDRLRAAGLIEPHALRVGQTRWMWHPIRSFRVMFFATWAGIRKPDEAISLWEKQTGQRNTRPRAAAASAAPGGDIRAWARSRGMEVNATGRIPADIRAAYEAERGQDSDPGEPGQDSDPGVTVSSPTIEPDSPPVRIVTVASGGRYVVPK